MPPVPRADAPKRKQESVYDHLLERFADGRIGFGAPLAVREIAAATGASKHPIMSALKELAAQGFVVITAQVGCQAIAPRAEEIADFFLMFSRMEGVMAELAARRRTGAEVDALAAINAAIARLPRRAAGSGERYRQLNREFHGAIHRMARSEALHRSLMANWAMSDFFISQSGEFARHLDEAAAEHAGIIAAIGAGAAARARRAMEDHILGFRLKVLARLGGPAARAR
ncbi:MAG: GntR family transcriptional regulator [Burkholderiales bacterium]|nr:GntR family transcriptional regulator [Burkholderiales bacterium]